MSSLWIKDRSLRACGGSLRASAAACPEVCGGAVDPPIEECCSTPASCQYEVDGLGNVIPPTATVDMTYTLTFRQRCVNTTPGNPCTGVADTDWITRVETDTISYTGPFDTATGVLERCAQHALSRSFADSKQITGLDLVECNGDGTADTQPPFVEPSVTELLVVYRPDIRRLTLNIASGVNNTFPIGTLRVGIHREYDPDPGSPTFGQDLCDTYINIGDGVDVQYFTLAEENACKTHVAISTEGPQLISSGVICGVVNQELYLDLTASVTITGVVPCPDNVPAVPCPFEPPPEEPPTECCDVDGACQPIDTSDFPQITLDLMQSRIEYRVRQQYFCAGGGLPGQGESGVVERWYENTLAAFGVALLPSSIVNGCPVYTASWSSGDQPMSGAVFNGCPPGGGFAFVQPADTITVRHDVNLTYRPGARYLLLSMTLRRTDVGENHPFADIFTARGLLEVGPSPAWANSLAVGSHFGYPLAFTMPTDWQINSFEAGCHTAIDYSGARVFEPLGTIPLQGGSTIRDVVTINFLGRCALSGVEPCALAQSMGMSVPGADDYAGLPAMHPSMVPKRSYPTCPQCPSDKAYSPCRGCPDCGFRPGCNGE